MNLRTIFHTPNEVKCPVCGCECVHPVALKVEPVSDDTVVYINHDGLHTVPSRAAERIRGIQITTTSMRGGVPVGRGVRLPQGDKHADD